MATRYISTLFKSGEEFEAFLNTLDTFRKDVESGKKTIPSATKASEIVTINGTTLKLFVGLQAVYDTLKDEEKENLFAIITDDTSKETIENAIKDLEINYATLDRWKTDVMEGTTKVPKATSADSATILENTWTPIMPKYNEYVTCPLEEGLYVFASHGVFLVVSGKDNLYESTRKKLGDVYEIYYIYSASDKQLMYCFYNLSTGERVAENVGATTSDRIMRICKFS